MGREVRRVPPNWQHPQEERPDHRTRSMELVYRPLYDHDAEYAWAEWQEEYARWVAGEHDRVAAEYGAADVTTIMDGAHPAPTNDSAAFRSHGPHGIDVRPSARRLWSQKSPFATRYSTNSSRVANGGVTGVPAVPALTVSYTWNHVASPSAHFGR